MPSSGIVTAADWIKGISFSIAASMIGGASKLAIRKSWLLEHDDQQQQEPARRRRQDERQPALDNDDSEGQNPTIHHSRYQQPQGEEDDESSRGSYSSVPSQGRMIPSHNDDHHRSAKRTTVLAWTLRLSGMVGMTFLNPLFCVLAMNYANPSILAPFSGLTLVWIVLFCKPLIGEQPQPSQIVAASLIVLGEIVVAFFGDHTNDNEITLEELRRSYQDVAFLLYFVATAIWMASLFYVIKYSKHSYWKRFAWGTAGGSITGLQNFLKDSLTIIKASPPHTRMPWYFFLMASLAILTAFGGLLLLTACMKRYDATYSAAMFVGSFVISASIMSAVHYHTFSNLASTLHYIFYPTGLLILMWGVYLLVWHTKESQAAAIDSDEDGMSAIETLQAQQRSFDLGEPLVSAGSHSKEEDHVTHRIT